MSKILDKIMYNEVISFFEKTGFFSTNTNQGSEKTFHMPCTSVLANSITDAFEKKKHLLKILLDLLKAFDAINHIILLDRF